MDQKLRQELEDQVKAIFAEANGEISQVSTYAARVDPVVFQFDSKTTDWIYSELEMNCALPLLASVKFPTDINSCLDVFKDNLALALQIVRSAGIEKLIQDIPALYQYFSLPTADDENRKRRDEIVRLIVFGIIGKLDNDTLALVYSYMCTEINPVTLS